MLNYLKAFSVFLLWAVIALASHFYISNHYFDNCFVTENNSQNKQLTANRFTITNSNNDTIYNSLNGLKITKNNSQVSGIPNFQILNDTVQYFLTDYSKELHIIGKYSHSEINPKPDKNLGLQRAEFVKTTFIKTGLASERIKTSGKIFNFLYDTNDFYTNGIGIKLKNVRLNIVDSIEAVLVNKTLYIEFENNNIISNNSLIEYTSKLKHYLQKYPTEEISITGHTDNLGYYDKNLIIGLNRANKLKEYFVYNGIDLHKITTFSKGESEPIAEKLTEKGRSKNKRIVININ